MANVPSALRRGLKRAAVMILGGVFLIDFLGTCDDRLINLTRFVDPCATFLANCTPGSLQVNRADIGDYCVDPACTVPGGCGQVDPPLGTQTRLCP